MSENKKNGYPEEFRISSVKLAREANQPIAQTAKELGINVNTLHTWIAKYSKSKEEVLLMKIKDREEIIRLKKELAKVTQERDLLKKAAAYFAKDSR